MDFVVGIEIQLSNNHTVLLQPGERTSDPSQQRRDGSPKANAVRPLTDICDTLAGRYPKDFKFTGWHPHCRCRAISILKTDEELAADTERMLRGEEPTNASVNTVGSVPAAFRQWLTDNADRISRAQQRSTLPLFLKDNQPLINNQSNSTSSIDQHFKIYKTFLSGGAIYLMNGLNKKAVDYKALLSIARYFAGKGSQVRITTKAHFKSTEYRDVFGALFGTRYERKCPDLIIDGAFYEFEGFVRPWNKRKISNMISHGLIQSDKIIIENTKGASNRYIRKSIMSRLKISVINEVWIYEKGEIWLFFKNGIFKKNNGRD